MDFADGWLVIVFVLILSLGIALKVVANKKLRAVPEHELPAFMRKRRGTWAGIGDLVLFFAVMAALKASVPDWPLWLRLSVGVVSFTAIYELARRIVRRFGRSGK